MRRCGGRLITPGVAFGPFTVLDHLGSGAFAEIWSAAHRSGERVALKIAHSTDRDLAALRVEAERLAGLNHGAVVHVYDVGLNDGRAWMALELAQGTLADLRTPLPVLTLARHLLAGLGHVHAHGLVHRDVKPSNILIGCRPRTGLDEVDRAGIRLADFGVSWGDASDLPSAGTQRWSAPEQAIGKANASSDVFAVARVLQSVLDANGRERMAGWLARALAPEPAQRFPTAAHAIAALPSTHSRTLPRVELPRDNARPTVTPAFDSSKTTTRVVLLALQPTPTSGDPCALLDPPCPVLPPIVPVRVPQVQLLDAGLSLLPHRPTLPIGRLELLYDLWEQLASGLHIRLNGATEDVEEVESTLQHWAREVAAPVTLSRGPGVTVPALSSWHLVRRAETLGIETRTALWLAMDCAHWPSIRARLSVLIDADLLDAGDDGLALRGGVPTERLSNTSLEEAWWAGHNLELARALADHEEHCTTPEEQARHLLYRARLERRRDQSYATQLQHAAEAATGELQHALQLERLGVLIRARTSSQASEVISWIEAHPSSDPRLQALGALQTGFVRLMERSPEALHHLNRARTLAGGRYACLALASVVDFHLQERDIEKALHFGHLALEAFPEARPDHALAAILSMVLAMVEAKLPEAEITVVLDRGRPLLCRTLNRSIISRFLLFRAQQAMRLQHWDEADRLLVDAQDLLVQSGGSGVFIILNYGLVGLHRGDLASIVACTPANWLQRTADAPAFLKPIMLLHHLFASLPNPTEADRVLAELEDLNPLSPITHDGIRLAADLGPSTLRERILGLIR